MNQYLQIRSAAGATVSGEEIRAEIQTEAAQKLAARKTLPEYPRVSRELAAQLDQRLDAVRQRLSITVACCAGCSYCCHGIVTAQAQEVFFAVDTMRQRLSAAALAGVIERAGARQLQLQARKTAAEQAAYRTPCPLLSEGRCGVYEGRPLVCRAHHSMSVEPCRQWFENPHDAGYDDHQHEAVFVTGNSVREGANAAFEAAGFDRSIYDFGSALYEALTDPRCVRRWKDGKKAFSTTCLARGAVPET